MWIVCGPPSDLTLLLAVNYLFQLLTKSLNSNIRYQLRRIDSEHNVQ